MLKKIYEEKDSHLIEVSNKNVLRAAAASNCLLCGKDVPN